jgi:hypothetical protein
LGVGRGLSDVAEVEGFAGADLEFFGNLPAAFANGPDGVSRAGNQGGDGELAVGVGFEIVVVESIDVGGEIGVGGELAGSLRLEIVAVDAGSDDDVEIGPMVGEGLAFFVEEAGGGGAAGAEGDGGFGLTGL